MRTHFGLAVAASLLVVGPMAAAGSAGASLERQAQAPLASVRTVVSSPNGSCAILLSSRVDCWGFGATGSLGNGRFYRPGSGSATPVGVLGFGGKGALSGVTALVSADGQNFCALLDDHRVDCWGAGNLGLLGDGKTYQGGHQGSAAPVSVVGPDRKGPLSLVRALDGGEGLAFCAVLAGGRVDCWGNARGGPTNSDVPVAIAGVGGKGSLSGVLSVVELFTQGTFCALLSSGGADCWGSGESGELGNGRFYKDGSGVSAFPVAVVGVSGKGRLLDIASLSQDGDDAFCALLHAGSVDCWGGGSNGQLGDGSFYSSGTGGSATPVAVVHINGVGPLTGVASLADSLGGSFCARLVSGAVDCWGAGSRGQLGDGVFHTSGNEGLATPVAVVGVGDIGNLTGDDTVVGSGGTVCAVLGTHYVDCWGFGAWGKLGSGAYYQPAYHSPSPEGAAVPVAVRAPVH